MCLPKKQPDEFLAKSKRPALYSEGGRDAVTMADGLTRQCFCEVVGENGLIPASSPFFVCLGGPQYMVIRASSVGGSIPPPSTNRGIVQW